MQKNLFSATLSLWSKVIYINLLVVVFFCLGCDHVFYQPLREMVDSPKKQGIEFEEFTIISADGEKLDGWWLYSKREASNGTFVQFHGNAENMSTHYRSLAWVTDAGFDLVVFDYRGYGTSTGTPEREMLVKDGIQLLDWVLKKSKAPDIFLVGQSLGGAVVVPVLAKSPSERVKLLVLDSTFDSYRKVARDKLAGFFLTWPFQYPLSYLVSDEFSPQDFIADISTPILFIHSKSDPVVPYARGLSLFEKVKYKAGKWEFDQSSHTAGFHIPELQFREKLIALVCELSSAKQSTCGVHK